MNRLSILYKSAFFKTIVNNFLCLETIGTIASSKTNNFQKQHLDKLDEQHASVH